MVYSIPVPNLPEFSKVLPSQIAKPYFYMFLFPAIAMFCKYEEGYINLIYLFMMLFRRFVHREEDL